MIGTQCTQTWRAEMHKKPGIWGNEKNPLYFVVVILTLAAVVWMLVAAVVMTLMEWIL